MNDLDIYSGGAITPQSPGNQGLPQSAPAGVPDYYVPQGNEFSAPDSDLPASIFGTPVDASGRQIEAHILRPIAQHFMNEMVNQRIPSRFIDAAANWFLSSALGNPKYEPVAHNYNVSGFPLAESDKLPLTSFLNRMAEVNVDNHTVRLMLSWYWQVVPRLLESMAGQHQTPAGGSSVNDLSDAEFKQVLKLQPKFQQQTKDHLRSLWGNHYSHRMQVASRYFAQLPETDREYFESAVCQGGVILGDSVEAIQWAYNEAVKQAKPNVTTDNLAGEIAAIENIMRTDRARYNSDMALQERLRLLYEMRGN